jgi:hypothetical protein
LSDAPIGVTNSGRFSTALHLPNRLNCKDIVDKVFEMCNCDDEERLLMENIATTVNSIPRLVEFMREFIILQQQNQQRDLNTQLINEIFVNNLFNDCATRIDERYKPQTFSLSDKILSAIVYGDDLELNNKDVLNALSVSLISNSLDVANRLTAHIKKVQTSVLMLWRFTNNKNILSEYIHRYFFIIDLNMINIIKITKLIFYVLL